VRQIGSPAVPFPQLDYHCYAGVRSQQDAWDVFRPVTRIAFVRASCILNSKIISITESLYSAPKSYRIESYPLEHKDLMVWADAFCINQLDRTELTS
jgi:hypothetical protein